MQKLIFNAMDSEAPDSRCITLEQFAAFTALETLYLNIAIWRPAIEDTPWKIVASSSLQGMSQQSLSQILLESCSAWKGCHIGRIIGITTGQAVNFFIHWSALSCKVAWHINAELQHLSLIAHSFSVLVLLISSKSFKTYFTAGLRHLRVLSFVACGCEIILNTAFVSLTTRLHSLELRSLHPLQQVSCFSVLVNFDLNLLLRSLRWQFLLRCKLTVCHSGGLHMLNRSHCRLLKEWIFGALTTFSFNIISNVSWNVLLPCQEPEKVETERPRYPRSKYVDYNISTSSKS